MKSFVIASFIGCSLVSAFQMPTQRMTTSRGALFSTAPQSTGTEAAVTPVEVEVAPETVIDPVITNSDEEEEVAIDFDALSKESATQAFQPKRDISDMYVKKERRAPRQAQWFPMLLSPPALDGSFAGDVGFDPLGFASDKAALYRMREAELKHARLAMLAAAGWPLSELWHKEIADALGLESILAEADKAPSVLNGGLANAWIIGAGIVALVIGGLLEFRTFAAQEKDGYKPGDLGFDPLGLHAFRASFGLDPIMENLTQEEKLMRAKNDMELCEIKNGRLAMIAVVGFVAQEFVTGIPVVQQTPFFFGDPIV